ncbi:MAG: hypothetical protein IKI15_10020 [Lachnospiraceae bacterium]|nr:hypothetical protein [Lachnospiraceae bacterium]
MSIFGKNKKIDEAERRRLRDGLAEFLRLNFRPGNEADTVAAAPVSVEAAQIASLEAQERAMKKAAMALTGNRRDGEQPFFMNAASAPGQQVGMAAAMMVPAKPADAEEPEEPEEPEEALVFDEEAAEDANHSFPVSAETLEYHERRPLFGSRKKNARREDACIEDTLMGGAASASVGAAPSMKEAAKKRSLTDVVSQVGETWQQSLLRKIDEKGFSDTEVYKRAGLDRKLFSKIRCNEAYQPKKSTAVAFALALQLTLDETRDMLSRAGYALSPSSRFDLIVEFFIDNNVYDLSVINEALYDHGETLLGA